jgi:hypothetical protein
MPFGWPWSCVCTQLLNDLTIRNNLFVAMHKAWPKLRKRMKQNKFDLEDDKDLVIMSRTWFCLYLFEHQ